LNLTATVEVSVSLLGKQTRFGQMVALMESASVSKPRIAMLADRVAKPFLGAVLLMAAVAAVWGWQFGPAHALMVAVSVLIVTCPCALSLATPAAMLSSAGALAKAGVMLRSLQALHMLAKVDTVIFDKTGTITHGSTVEFVGPKLSETLMNTITSLAAQSSHPLSRKIYEQFSTNNNYKVSEFEELPGKKGYGILFNTDKKELIDKFKLIKWDEIAFLSTNSAYNLRSSQIYELFND
jgi:Cu2+-exporting ATPase